MRSSHAARAVACAILAGLSVVALGSPRAAVAQAREERVGFQATLTPDTIYVGQQATYSLTVRIPADVRQRLRRNPEFEPPELRAMLGYDLRAMRESPDSSTEVHVLRRALFVLAPGRYAIAPARLTYALPQSQSFFSREEQRAVRAEGVSFVAIEPPARGRPTDWNGAVGQWRVTARVDATSPRLGDPLTLTLRVEGTGNATLLPRPAINVSWADVVPADERVSLDSSSTMLGGSKEFTWLVTARESGARTIPALGFHFFDPTARRYEVARTEPMRVTVAAGDRVAMPVSEAARARALPLELRTTLGGPAMAPSRVAGFLLLLALFAPLPWLWRFVSARREMAANAAAAPAPLSARAAFDAAMRERTRLPLEDFTAPGALSRALRLEGVTAEAADEAERVRDAFDLAAYGQEATSEVSASLAARAATLLARIGSEARALRGAVWVFAFASVAGTSACGGAASSTDATRAFAEGRTTYSEQRYDQAQARFRVAATLAPRDPAAWSNFGDAAWQAADTANAVLGWQRALRLDPTDRVTRERLTRVRAPQRSGDARVIPVPPLIVAAIAAALWIAAWVAAYRGASATDAGSTVPLRLLGGAAMLLAVTAFALDSRLAARNLAVVAESRPLLSLPALGAEPSAVPLVGEIVRIVERREVWVRLELSGNRGGWYPAERVLPLRRD